MRRGLSPCRDLPAISCKERSKLSRQRALRVCHGLGRFEDEFERARPWMLGCYMVARNFTGKIGVFVFVCKLLVLFDLFGEP